MKNFKVILNPHGGQNRGPRILKKIIPLFDSSNVKLNIIETNFSGHAKDLANQLDYTNYDGLIIIGGDGTIHEVLNGILSRKKKSDIPIGIIPGGSGNSFMHDLGLTDPISATKSIIKGNLRKIDIAKISLNHIKKYAFNIIGWGLVTDIGISAEKWRVLGESRYTILSIFEVLRYKPRNAILILDDKKIVDDFVFVIACNTIHTGKGMQMAPKAKLDDGLIDVIVVRKGVSKLQLLSILPKVYDGSHLNSPYLEYYQVSKFCLKTKNNQILNIDGEVLGTTPIEVEVIPNAFTIIN